ncbi:response regulator [Candidatus Sumerlaeota bacterium]|nr:response regulator [Candidatus Sumerlaeota bacterium]
MKEKDENRGGKEMSKLVYVLDDEEAVCEIIRIVLESRGYSVATADDGEKGLKMIKEKKPDILIVDLKMPKLNGYELISQLKLNPELADIPIIVITSLTTESEHSDEEWREKMGVQDFISKPFEPLELVERIEKIIGNNTKSPE